MHHSFFTTALLMFSAALVHAQDTNTPAGQPSAPTGTTSSPPATPKQGNAPALPPSVKVQCTASFMPFSERDLADMAKLDSTAGNSTSIPDPATLSDVPSSTFCKDDTMTAVCMLDSCKLTPETTTACNECYEYTLNAAGDDGTVSSVNVGKIVCDENYNFNKTDTKTPFLCSNKEQKKIYSCKDCSQPRSCDNCYDVKALAAST